MNADGGFPYDRPTPAPVSPWPPVDSRSGPDADTARRLLGEVKGKRVLELGCGTATWSIDFAKLGATAIGVDASAEKLATARFRCEQEEVRVEFRQGDLADLAFLRADSIDAVFSDHAFATVEDLDRLFRQVHRVLRAGAPLVFSVPHPAARLVDTEALEPLLVRRSYFDRSPIEMRRDGEETTEHQHTFADVHGGLARAGYRVDTVVEPEPDTSDRRAFVPRTLLVRARKEGV